MVGFLWIKLIFVVCFHMTVGASDVQKIVYHRTDRISCAVAVNVSATSRMHCGLRLVNYLLVFTYPWV